MNSLVDEINQAVTQSLVRLSSEAAWRKYTGAQQEALVVALAELLGTHHVDLASSGTAALEMILRACRLAPGQEVMLSAYDYPGNFAAIERVGARPVLVDVSPSGWDLSRESLANAYSPQCRVLIASHLHGQMQDVEALHAWCRARGIILVQDACQALGATLASGGKLGQACDATIVSFGGSKTVSAGRGGAWATNDPSLAQHARAASGGGSGAFRMSELQASAVLAQLPFLEKITQLTRDYFTRMLATLEQLCPSFVAPWEGQLDHTAFYQAGWIATDKESCAMPYHAGKGFDGFHRRSQRRCRISVPLDNTARISKATWSIHHQVALAASK